MAPRRLMGKKCRYADIVQKLARNRREQQRNARVGMLRAVTLETYGHEVTSGAYDFACSAVLVRSCGITGDI